MENRTARLLTAFFALVLVTVVAIPAVCETEPNNTIATANVVDLGTGIVLKATESGALNPDVPSDVIDCYKFTVPNDGMFQIGVVPVAELDVWVHFLDTDGLSLLAGKNDTRKGGTEGVVHTSLRAGTYYAIVGLAEGAGTYDITFTFAQVAENDPEPNDTVPQAVELRETGEAKGHIGYYGSLYSDYFDYYVVSIPDDGTLELTAFPDGGLNIALQLLDSDGTNNLVWEDRRGKGESEKIVYENLAAGTYYVLIYRSDGTGSYTLTSIYTGFSDPSDAEPNDTITTPTEIVLAPSAGGLLEYEASVQGRLGFYGNQYQDNEDYYKIDTPAYGDLILNFKPGAGNNVAKGCVLYDREMREIRGWDTNNTITWNGLGTSVYYLRVARTDRFGGYTLSCTLKLQNPPEPFAAPTTDLPVNGTISDINLSTVVSPNAYFAIELPEDGRLVLRGRYASEVDVETYLFNADGTTNLGNIRSWGSTNEMVVDKPDLRKGTYIVGLIARGGAGLGSLRSEFTPVTKLDQEPNDIAFPDISPFVINQSIADEIIFSGHIGYGGNGYTDVSDFFRLDLRDDGIISVTGTGASTLDYEIYLYEYRGYSYNRLQNIRSWGSANPLTITEPDVLAGQYVLQVVRRGGYGSYDLAINFSPNRSSDLEPNDQRFLAVPISLGQGVVGHLGYDYGYHEDSVDWYRLDIPEDGYFGLSIFGDRTLDYEVYLYWSDACQTFDNRRSWAVTDVQSVGHGSIKAGTCYILVMQRGGYGTYQFYTVFKRQPAKDTQENNYAPMAQPLGLGTVAQGALGYSTNHTFDQADWYSVRVPAAARFKLSYQAEPGLDSEIYFYNPDMLSVVHNYRNWGASGLYEKEMELGAGTYYILCYQRSGAGRYTFRFGDVAGTSVGTLTGTVSSSSGFPLFEINVQIRDQKIKTDFAGTYSFDKLPPGTYMVGFSSGAKYYDLEKEVEIGAGKNTVLDVTMFDANKTAPYDVEHLFAVPNDRYIHLFWSASRAPDVADGGGYKLYIDNQAPLNLGNVLFYRSDGFENGRIYNFRLTVYDKFGNESTGTTIQVTPSGPGPAPTPTPVVGPTHTPVPTPTSTPTLRPGVTPTPTFPPVPTYTPIPVELTPLRVFEMNSLDEFVEYPGGFINAAAGWIEAANIPGPVEPLTDGKGLTISTGPGAVELLLFPTLGVGEHIVLLRASVQATGPGATIALAALDGSMDGSIATNIPNSDTFQGSYKRMVLVFDPPGTSIIPVFQVANLSGTEEIQVYLDRLEIYLIPRELGPLASLIYGE
jgi:hypothetical protein